MPHKPHPCAHPECTNLVQRKEAVHCRKHVVKTPEHIAKITAALRGRKLSPQGCASLSQKRRAAAAVKLNRSPSVARTCEWCKKDFTAEKPSSVVRFCSKDCGYKNRSGNRAKHWCSDMPIITCRVCGVEFRAKTKTAPRYTCSYFCKSAWQLKHQKNKGTNIERAIQHALEARGWHFDSQVPLEKIAIVDFYLPDSKTVIFCDGDYWHRLPGHQARDAVQTTVLQDAGYTVYRFWGKDILRDADACLDQITRQ